MIFALFDVAVKIVNTLELVMTGLSFKTICNAGCCKKREEEHDGDKADCRH